MNIRPATPADLDRLMEIFDAARRFMAKTGNPNQWINGYPQRGLIADEISRGHRPELRTHRGRSVAGRQALPRHPPDCLRRKRKGDFSSLHQLVRITRFQPPGRHPCRQQGNAAPVRAERLHPVRHHLRSQRHAPHRLPTDVDS